MKNINIIIRPIFNSWHVSKSNTAAVQTYNYETLLEWFTNGILATNKDEDLLCSHSAEGFAYTAGYNSKYLMPAVFNNSSFESDLENERYKGVLYYFTIEKDEEYDHYELSIFSSSLAELDDEENAELTEGYSYIEEYEAREDIELAAKKYKIDFEENK